MLSPTTAEEMRSKAIHAPELAWTHVKDGQWVGFQCTFT